MWSLLIPPHFKGPTLILLRAAKLWGVLHIVRCRLSMHTVHGRVQCVLLSQFPVPGAILRTPSLNNLHIPLYSFSFSLTVLSKDILKGNAWLACPVYGENPLLKCYLCCRMQQALSYEPKLESTTELVLHLETSSVLGVIGQIALFKMQQHNHVRLKMSPPQGGLPLPPPQINYAG